MSPRLTARAGIAPAQKLLTRLDLRLLAAFGLPFGLYLLTLAPTIYNLDSAELTTAAATLGLTRSTGYPLYILVGHFWSMLPIGDVGYRMNLFSAFWGAVTIALAAAILRQLRVGPWATFGALGLLASARFFWGLSLIAEVYTLHTALTAALILSLLRWGEPPRAQTVRSPARMAAVGLVLGLGLSHHAATVLLVPGAIVYILAVDPKTILRPRTLLAGLAGLALGLSFYLYLPWRYGAMPPFNYAGLYDANGQFHPINLRSLDGLWTLVSGKSFAELMFSYTPRELWGELLRFGADRWRAFAALGIGPGLLGLFLLCKRDARAGLLLVLMFTGHALFFISYRVIDKELMFLPDDVIWAIWLGVGYEWLLALLQPAQAAEHPGTGRSDWIIWTRRGLQALLVAVVLMVVVVNWRLVDQSSDWSTRQLGESILQQVEPRGLIFGYWEVAPVLEYLQLVEGQRPDVQIINRFLIPPAEMQQWILTAIPTRPVYVDSRPSGLPLQILSVPTGELDRLELDSMLPGGLP